MGTGPIWSQLLIQALLIAANAFFASTEIAILSINDTKIRYYAEDNDEIAQRLLKLKETPEGFLSTIQIGITLAGFLGSAFAASNFANRIAAGMIKSGVTFISASAVNTLCVILVTLILSFFTLVFGELVPKLHRDDAARKGCAKRLQDHFICF